MILPYLGVLGVQHFLHEGVFYYQRLHWPTRIYCRIAAMTSFVSSQMSLTVTVVIAVQRAYVIAFPFKLTSHQKPILAATLSWGLWVTLAIIPYIPSYFNESQMSLMNDMCLLQDLRLNNPWKAVFAVVFLGLNIVLHSIITICSCITYRCVARSNKDVRKAHQNCNKVRQVRMKMLLVSVSDIISNLPMYIISVITLCGVAPTGLMWAIIAVVVVPLPTIIYPIAYI